MPHRLLRVQSSIVTIVPNTPNVHPRSFDGLSSVNMVRIVLLDTDQFQHAPRCQATNSRLCDKISHTLFKTTHRPKPPIYPLKTSFSMMNNISCLLFQERIIYPLVDDCCMPTARFLNTGNRATSKHFACTSSGLGFVMCYWMIFVV